MGRFATHGDDLTGFVCDQAGEMAALIHLPPPGAQRWVSRRKAEVVAAVQAGLLTLGEACRRYALSVEEFMSWQQSIERHGLAGLRATHLQKYRHNDSRHPAH